MQRTQIYLSKEQADALDREAKQAGTTRSHLIRDAIERTYVVKPDRDHVAEALRATAGAWKDRQEDGATYVAKLRTGRRWSELYPEDSVETPDERE